MKQKLTQKRLKALLRYDPKLGIWIWRKRILSQGRTNRKAGKIAGWISKSNGYRRIGINCKIYKASRLAWLYMEGYFPEHEVDHKNRIRDDDRWKNLRHFTRQCNARNTGQRKDNRSGVTGVFWDKRYKKWASRITLSKKNIHLGYFKSKLDAVGSRWEAEKKYNFTNCNSTSSAYQYLQKNKVKQ